jgi:hypothetical protein
MPEIPVPNLDAPIAAPSPAPASEPAAPSPTPDATAAPSPAPDASPAASSPADATPASSPGTTDLKTGLLAAVKKAVEPKTEAVAGSEQAKPEEDPAKGSEPDELPENVTQEEAKNYSPKAQKRISKLLQQREEARSMVRETEPFRDFMRDNELGAEDLAFGLQALATLKKGDFEGFLQQVQPFVQLAEEYTGRRIPDDLREQVRQGRMTPDVAASLSRQRMDLGRARQELDQRDQYEGQRREEEAREANRSAVAVWEQTIKQTDPDYARKLPLAKAFVAQFKQEYGDPQSEQDSRAMAQEAYRMAGEQLKPSLPPRTATQMTPSGAQRPSNPSAVAYPRSLEDVVRQGLSRR